MLNYAVFRSDWSEYLDSDSPHDSRRFTGEEDDVKIVTEMPNEMFKRPKQNKDSCGSSSVTGGNELFKPSFSRHRNIKKPDSRSDGVMMRKKDTEQRNLESGRVASKWDAYLIDDEGENRAQVRFGSRDVVKDDHVGEWDRAIMETSSNCGIVDDEVHPDFM